MIQFPENKPTESRMEGRTDLIFLLGVLFLLLIQYSLFKVLLKVQRVLFWVYRSTSLIRRKEKLAEMTTRYTTRCTTRLSLSNTYCEEDLYL